MVDKLVEISNAADIWKRDLWGSRWCDSRHMRRRSTIAVVHCGDPLGKLVSLWSPSDAHFVGTGSVPVFLAMVWQCPAARGSLYSELAAKFRI